MALQFLSEDLHTPKEITILTPENKGDRTGITMELFYSINSNYNVLTIADRLRDNLPFTKEESQIIIKFRYNNGIFHALYPNEDLPWALIRNQSPENNFLLLSNQEVALPFEKDLTSKYSIMLNSQSPSLSAEKMGSSVYYSMLMASTTSYDIASIAEKEIATIRELLLSNNQEDFDRYIKPDRFSNFGIIDLDNGQKGGTATISKLLFPKGHLGNFQ